MNSHNLSLKNHPLHQNDLQKDPKLQEKIDKHKEKEKARLYYSLVEEYAKQFQNNQTFFDYYMTNVVSPPFFKLNDYEDYEKIRQSIPSCAKMNNPDFEPTKFQNARFFIIRSYCEDDVHKAIKYGNWCSTNLTNQKLDKVFKKCYSMDAQVFLIFT